MTYTSDRSEPRLELCTYDSDFLECSWLWLNDPVIKKLTMTPDFDRSGQEKWFRSLPTKTDYAIFGVKLDGTMIGACGLKNMTSTDAEYWGYIGEPTYWGMGLGKQLVSDMMARGRQRGLSSLWLKVAYDNLRAVRLYERMGFVKVVEENGVLTMRVNLAADNGVE
jgi:RimJ/RimL family protein N-acetyltransferase